MTALFAPKARISQGQEDTFQDTSGRRDLPNVYAVKSCCNAHLSLRAHSDLPLSGTPLARSRITQIR